MRKTPAVTIDDQYLSTHLNIQKTAARAYLAELQFVGILLENGRATDLANSWRLDDSYSSAVDQIVEAVYPDGLRNLAPAAEGDRAKVVRWFENAGLGQGTAGNKAATYLLIGSPTPNEAVSKATSTNLSSEKNLRGATQRRQATGPKESVARVPVESVAEIARPRPSVEPDSIPLNVNVQIHIGADIGADR